MNRIQKSAAALCAVALLVAGVALEGCSKKSSNAPLQVKNDRQWAEFVAEHSSGLTSRVAQLRVRFVTDAVAESAVGKPLTGLVSFEPALKASAVFNNPRELVIVPEAPLPSGKQVLVTLAIKALPSLPATLGDFKFVVDVLPQDASVTVTSIRAPDGDSGDALLVEGILSTTDVADADAVEKVLRARVADGEWAIQWQHDSEGRSHFFTTAPVLRGEESKSLELSWDASSLGGTGKGERAIEIPARGVFSVTRIDRVISDTNHIVVGFSEPLAPRQNINGLVTLSSGDFTSRIEGNTIALFPTRSATGEVVVTVGSGVRAADGRQLGAEVRETIVFETLKPEVRFVGKGAILPDAERLTIPFEAINVASVQVTAFRVYDQNFGQFLQVNPLGGSHEMKRVGRYLWRKTVPLGAGSMNQWRRFAFDATELFKSDPGGLFQLTISINRGNSLYACSDAARAVPVPPDEPLQNGDEYDERQGSGWDGIENWYDEDGDWQGERVYAERKDPCKDSYYRYDSGAKQSRNFVAANLGIIAKAGTDQGLRFAVTDIRSGKPVSGANLRLFNYQNREIAKGSSDGDGMLELKPEVRAFYALAERGGQRGYLKLGDGLALPVSHFDVGGVKVERGIKGTIFGERGVWRPGDVVHLTFVLQDPQDAIPDTHPATLELINPSGQTMYTAVVDDPTEGFYAFHVRTAEADPTGGWRAVVKLGGRSFERPVKIETVMPNRLKVELDAGIAALKVKQNPELTLFGQWLHGASAAGLNADVKVKLRPLPTRFTRAGDFIFDDPTRKYEGDEQTLFDGRLGEDGRAKFNAAIVPEAGASGALKANFTSRVFEPGGAFSISVQDTVFHPYRSYVGIKLPKGDPGRDMLLTDVDHVVEVASLDADGAPVALDSIKYTVHKLQWRWWWEQGEDSLAEYGSGRSAILITDGTTSTKDGAGRFKFQVKYPDWGRYMIRACDEDGGHCAAAIKYIDWPGWAGRAQEQSGPGANALTLYADKPQYTVGETATVNLPPASKGRALLSIENGSGVMQQRWLELGEGRNSFELPVTAAMAPNVYVSVTLLQAHEGKDNDRPIRLYGVLPVLVTDPGSILKPQLDVAASVRPNSNLAVGVSEAGGRPMTYMLAVVDEGLLGLTNFRTPDLHGEFYKREALGVRTWDMFDEVVGAYGGELERLLALGGSDGGPMADPNKERKRFPPVVRVLGPFQLEAGKAARHEVPLPPYVGAVRVMVVAGKAGAYGSVQREVAVKQPVMVQATVPRVIGPGEELRIPVSVFVLEDSIREVTVTTTVDDRLTVVGEASSKLAFARASDKLGFVRVKVGERLGKTRIKFVAASGAERAEQVIDVEVRAPNPATTVVQRSVIEPGQTWAADLKPHGLKGTNETVLEASAVPAFDLDGRLQYLIRFPHGCVEQTTSAAFPQLYLSKLLPLSEAEEKRAQSNVTAGIERLRQFQLASGAFGYWPGASEVNTWSTTYVGHFLIEAQRAGYAVPANVMQSWKGWQRGRAQNWYSDGGDGSQLDQAYRLYVLALSGAAELGAMNRLREQPRLGNSTRWLLAGAYKAAGLGDVAAGLVKDADTSVGKYETEGMTFGSGLRDRALLLEVATVLGDQLRAKELADAVASDLNTTHWYSTHSVSWSLLALGHFVGEGSKGGLRFDHALDSGEWQNAQSTTPLRQVPLGVGDKAAKLRIANRGEGRLWVNVATRGIAPVGEETASSDGLEMSVSFDDGDGRSLAPDALPQGSDFVATVRVRNSGPLKLENLALSQVVPSGWEILATREQVDGESAFDYRDFRDDRVLTYFQLKPGEQRSFLLRLNAAYLGRYYLPGWNVEAMYDQRKHARNAGRWVTVGDERAAGR